MNTPLTPKIELTERERFRAIRAEIDHADEQLEGGEFEEYDESTIQEFAEDIKSRGQARLTYSTIAP